MKRAGQSIFHRLCFTAVTLFCVTALFGCASAEEETALARATSYIETQEYDEALSILEEEIAEGRTLREAYRASGIAYLGKGSYEEAIAAFENALSLSDGIVTDMDYDINYYLATAYVKMGNYEEATAIYDAILSLRPEEADAYYLRGILNSEQGLADAAKLDFDRALALEPENYDRLINIYEILAENGYKETGQLYLRNAMESGEKKMTDFTKGRISFYLEDYESARTYLEKAREDSEFGAVLFLGKTYEILGDNNYAISVYSSYLSAGGTSPEIYNEMGLCYLKMGDYESALSAFESALRTEEGSMTQTLRYNEIIAYEYLGDFASARSLLEGYLKSYPDDENAKREYVFLKTR